MERDFLELLLARLGGGVPITVSPDGRYASLPDGVTLESLAPFREYPERIKQTVIVDSASDFCAYVNRFKNADSTIFINPQIGDFGSDLARCVIDYHNAPRMTPPPESLSGDAQARWNEHQCVLRVVPSPEYALLLAFHKAGVMDQFAFAQKLQDAARFITSHSAAEILEIARTISLTSKGSFKTFEDDFSGSVDFKYDLQVSASAGSTEKRLQVPREVTFHCPILLGGALIEIRAELIYRVPPSAAEKVQLGLRLPDKAWMEREAIMAVSDELHTQTELQTLVGTFK